jgi:hypothetical protein
MEREHAACDASCASATDREAPCRVASPARVCTSYAQAMSDPCEGRTSTCSSTDPHTALTAVATAFCP